MTKILLWAVVLLCFLTSAYRISITFKDSGLGDTIAHEINKRKP